MSAGSVQNPAPPSRPQVAVGAVVLDEAGRVLLIQRGQLPAKGRWTVPGGRVEFGETLTQALLRELEAETGMTGRVGALCEVFEYIDERFHYVILDYLVHEPRGTLAAGEDAADARFFTLDEIAALETTDGLLAVLKRAIVHAAR
ncbi:MAG: NUDIX hydrolase [Polyangia bacterium]